MAMLLVLPFLVRYLVATEGDERGPLGNVEELFSAPAPLAVDESSVVSLVVLVVQPGPGMVHH